MTYHLYSNPSSHSACAAAKQLAERLLSLGERCIADDDNNFAKDICIETFRTQECDNQCDIFISVGGDGTMLNVAQRAIESNKPLVGINAGRIGFLCAFETSEIDSLTTDMIEKLELDERMLLDVSLSNSPNEHYIAVNDVVVCKGGLSKTVELRIESSDKLVGEYRSDGVIVATPTGSTAYSLSAGGPIIEPSLDIIAVTPICAHSMFSRCMIIDGSKPIRISPSGRNDNSIFVSVDSNYILELQKNESAVIRKSQKRLKLMTNPSRDYYGMIDRRLMKGD